MRVVPYTVGPRAFSGTVISFVDITASKEAQRALAEKEVALLGVIAARAERDQEWHRIARPAGEGGS